MRRPERIVMLHHLVAAGLVRPDDPVTVHVTPDVPGDGTETWHATDGCPKALPADGTRPRTTTAADVLTGAHDDRVHRCACLSNPTAWHTGSPLTDADAAALRWLLSVEGHDNLDPAYAYGDLNSDIVLCPAADHPGVVALVDAELGSLRQRADRYRRDTGYGQQVAVKLAGYCLEARADGHRSPADRLRTFPHPALAALLYGTAGGSLGDLCTQLLDARRDGTGDHARLAAEVHRVAHRHQVWVFRQPGHVWTHGLLRFATDVAPGNSPVLRLPLLALWKHGTGMRLLTARAEVSRATVETAAALTVGSPDPVDELLDALDAASR